MKKIHSEKQKTGAGQRDSRSPNEAFERRIILYALAAGAAAGCAATAQAKVVFTANQTVLHNGEHLNVDLNNDGKEDFRLNVVFSPSIVYFEQFGAYGAAGNSVEVKPTLQTALALTKNASIGSNANFTGRGILAHVSSFGSGGQFNNTSHRFLGVRFLINGATHYGWIGFRRVAATIGRPGRVAAMLDGWAYETETNTPILAGATGGSTEPEEAAMAAAPSSLELLAAGNVALVDWRRRRVG